MRTLGCLAYILVLFSQLEEVNTSGGVKRLQGSEKIRRHQKNCETTESSRLGIYVKQCPTRFISNLTCFFLAVLVAKQNEIVYSIVRMRHTLFSDKQNAALARELFGSYNNVS